MKQSTVYILTNKENGTLYVGVTADLARRIYEHKNGLVKGFTEKYGCKLLVFYEFHETMESAIVREKQLKGGSRKQKLDLIETMNPYWDDLYEEL
ncbi:MAG TPA: GIY-YIG nuclease family protein [Candidatus Babeliales bacterium]|nr:GIY-YIG nuclease family protein [Candidatus Babeliales bacterium]